MSALPFVMTSSPTPPTPLTRATRAGRARAISDGPVPRRRSWLLRARRALLALVTATLAFALPSAAPAEAATRPVVSGLSVSAGAVRGGTWVTVTGTGLRGATKVWFGRTSTTRLAHVGATSIQVLTPAHPAGVVTVRVTNRAGTSLNTARATFAYEPVPQLTAMTARTGPAQGGTSLTLTGSGLSRASVVRFGGATATNLVRVSATTLRVTTPAHPLGRVDVRVTTPGGTSAVTAQTAFTYGRVPQVTRLAPNVGPLRAGTVVTVTGTDLAGATRVWFGASAGTGLVRLSTTQVRVTAPAHAAGDVAVRITTPVGTSPSTGPIYRYLAAPAVTALSVASLPSGPAAGPVRGGTTVTVTGRNLRDTSEVRFGAVLGTSLVRMSDTQLRVTSPAGQPGTVAVTVRSPGGTSASTANTQFTYQLEPVVTSVSPALSPTRGGSYVTVRGANFAHVGAVLFGTTQSRSFTRVSSTQLRVLVPAHPEGVDTVRVVTPGGTSAPSTAARFTYQDAPTIARLSPASGPLAGGTVVTLTGTSLTGVTGVWVNGVRAGALTPLSRTQLRFTVPARALTGTVPVKVTTPAGTVSLSRGFTYSAGAVLRPGQVLTAGTALVSARGGHAVTMGVDGNLVLTSGGVRRWASGTTGPGNRLTVRADGSAVILRSNGTVAWSTGTSGFPGALLEIGGDGVLLVKQGSKPLWDPRSLRFDRLIAGEVLRSGQTLTSRNHAFKLTMRTDGNLVVTTAAGRRTWASFTSSKGATAVMRGDGNLTIRSVKGAVLWSSKTTGAAAFAKVGTDGNLGVFTGTTVRWAIWGGPAPTDWRCFSVRTRNCVTRYGYVGQRAWNYPVDPWGNNCTNFAAYRVARDGVRNPGNLGNALTWDTNARAKGFRVDQRPKVGDVAQWNSNHVAYVDWVNSTGTQIAISETGYGGTVLGKTYTSFSGRRIISRGSASWPSNFIHFR